MTSQLLTNLLTIVRTNRPAPTVTRLLLALTGIIFLIIGSQYRALAEPPIRIKSTRTSSGSVGNLPTTRLRVTTSTPLTRIATITEAITPPKPSGVQKVALQDSPIESVVVPSTDDTGTFLPVTEVVVEQNLLKQPLPNVTTPSSQNDALIIEAPTPTQPIPAGKQDQSTSPESDNAPVLLIGQAPLESEQPVQSTQPVPPKLVEKAPTQKQQEPEETEISPAAPELPTPQTGVLDPLAGATGAAIQVAPMLDPKNCGTPDCEKASTLISAKPISEISLDISPSFKPNLDQKPPKLQQETRKWRNREGQVLAEGQLADYAYSSVHIKGSDGELRALPISELSVDDVCYIADAWGFPKQCRIDNSPYEQRAWESLNFHWRASAVAHKPIYFEDAQLERHGHTLGPWLQPIRSGAHFFTNIAILPYQMGIHPWNECQYALGYHRPGSLAPRVKPAFPISRKAALIQAGSVLGGVFIIP